MRYGASNYVIVHPANSSPSQIYAAKELQSFTRQMTGATLPIVTDDASLPAAAILLGETRHTAAVLGETLPPEGKKGGDGVGGQALGGSDFIHGKEKKIGKVGQQIDNGDHNRTEDHGPRNGSSCVFGFPGHKGGVLPSSVGPQNTYKG